MRASTGWFLTGLRIVDVLVLASLMTLFTTWSSTSANASVTLLFLLVVPLTQVLLARSGVYDSHRLEGGRDVVRKLLQAYVAAAVIVLPVAWLLASRQAAQDLAAVFASSFAVLATFKVFVYVVLRRLRRRGFDVRSVLLVGSWTQAEGVDAQFRQHPEWGLRLDCIATGELDNRCYYCFASGERIGPDLEDILKQRVIDEVLVPVGKNSVRSAFEETRHFELYGLLVRLVFEPVAGAPARTQFEDFGGATSLKVASTDRSEHKLALKRVFDISIAALLLVVSSPVLLLIAALIKLTSPGPVLFTQIRVGLNGRRFRMLKFRTMINGAEYLVRQAHRSITKGPIFKDPQDYRITAFGKLLRKFSLDELPQLWNVVRGEMSLVGPRPLPVYEAEQINGEYRRRFSMPPGLTCFWQVSGRSNVAFDSWMQYDLQYVDRWSLWTDTKLLFKTIPAVLTGRGGY